MKILHLDKNHPLLIQELNHLGCVNDEDYTSSKKTIENIIYQYDGLIIRSRFKLDKQFLNKATSLKFIARLGAGLENIDVDYAQHRKIALLAAAEGNRNAVAEHTLGLLLSLFNNIVKANNEVKSGQWFREANRGLELDGKTIGIIGYGNTGKTFAKKLKGFDVEVLCHDIIPNVEDGNAKQVPLHVLQQKTDVLSLHVPLTTITSGMVNTPFINQFKNPFWLLNTSRGSCVITKDLVQALKSKAILGAGLDVLEHEKSSFETIFQDNTKNQKKRQEALQYLIKANNVILTPHVAGWTVDSYKKMSEIIVSKIKAKFY